MWQPIETAPRDQTFLAVLNCAGEQTICTMRWPVAEAKNSRPDSKTFHVERVTHWMPLPDLPGTQPAPSVPNLDMDALERQNDEMKEEVGRCLPGAMEEVAIWKRRALEAEDLNRKFIAEINGPTHMGEPAPSVPHGWLRAIDEALVTTHIGVANANDTYEQAKSKLDSLIGFHVDVAIEPTVNGGWKLVPIASTYEMDLAGSNYCDGLPSTARQVWDAMLDVAPDIKS